MTNIYSYDVNGCHGCYIIKYNKDLTFNQMRNHIYNKYYDDKSYYKNRCYLKSQNKDLHDAFYKFKKITMNKLIEAYITINDFNISRKINTNLINAKLFGNYDGNDQNILAEDDKYYYVIGAYS